MPVAKFGALPKGRADAKDSSRNWSDRGDNLGTRLHRRPASNAERSAGRDFRIPVEVYDGFGIVAKGHIDSLSGLNFLIDTGQTYTSVDRAIADKLGLDVSSSRNASILNLDKKEPARFCRLAEIGMGRFEEEAVPVIVDDLRWLRSDGLHIDAVIGLDLLRKRETLCVSTFVKSRSSSMRPRRFLAAQYLSVRIRGALR